MGLVYACCMLKRWETLTRFLSVPGAPLDNIAERGLKTAILHRRNSLSYKTLAGARVGDINSPWAAPSDPSTLEKPPAGKFCGYARSPHQHARWTIFSAPNIPTQAAKTRGRKRSIT